MEPPQLQKVKQCLANFEKLQEKHQEFGANDKEADYQFQRGIKEMVTRRANIFPLTMAEWGLFKNMPDCQKVADALNQSATETITLLQNIDWNSPLAPSVKNFLASYCTKLQLFEEPVSAQTPKLHSMESYAGVKWFEVKNESFDPSKSWEENYRLLEARHVQETTHLINKVRELAFHLPGNVMLATKTIHLIQMPDGKYVRDWSNKPASLEIITVADPFEALQLSEQEVQKVFETYFAKRGGKIIPITISLKLAETKNAAKNPPESATERLVKKFVKKFPNSGLVKAFAEATLEGTK